ncbi:MAG: hypothetical protein ACYS1B_05940, partial [Planctomycetota bacterium]
MAKVDRAALGFAREWIADLGMPSQELVVLKKLGPSPVSRVAAPPRLLRQRDVRAELLVGLVIVSLDHVL